MLECSSEKSNTLRIEDKNEVRLTMFLFAPILLTLSSTTRSIIGIFD
jgi:hypothetical protein